MVFISAEDFFSKVETMAPLTDEEFRELVLRINHGDKAAGRRLVQGFLPFVASFIRRAPRHIQTLHTVYACIAIVKERVDRGDCPQNPRTFAADLGRRLRYGIVRCLIAQTAE